MALPPTSVTLSPSPWPSALPTAQPYPPQLNLGLPQQGVTTFTPSILPPAPETETTSPTKANPYALPLTAVGGLAMGSLLPNPLGLLNKKVDTTSNLPQAVKNAQFSVESQSQILDPDSRLTFVSPKGHAHPTRIEGIHDPESQYFSLFIDELAQTSKRVKLPGSGMVGDIPVFTKPYGTVSIDTASLAKPLLPHEASKVLEAHLEAGTKPEWKLAERTLTDAEVDEAIKSQTMAFLNPEAEATFKAALADESDPIAKAGAEVAERMAKLLQHHEAKGEQLFDVAVTAIPNALPEELLDKVLTSAGGAVQSAEDGKQAIMHEAFTLLQDSWKNGELLAHFRQLTHIK